MEGTYAVNGYQADLSDRLLISLNFQKMPGAATAFSLLESCVLW